MTVAPFPFNQLPRLSRADARAQSVVARWLAAASGAARPSTTRLAKLFGTDDLRARVVSTWSDFDPYAAGCVVRVDGVEVVVRGSSLAVRALANTVIGGATELAAPRSLNVVEESIWCLVVATALEDLGIPGVVWPLSGNRTRATGSSSIGYSIAVELQAGEIAFAIQLHVPSGIDQRVPRTDRATRATPHVPAWAETATIVVPVVVGRCGIAASDLHRLQVRSLVTIDVVGQAGVVDISGASAATAWGPRPRVLRGQAPTIAAAELEVLGGVVGVRAKPGAVVGEVATGYLPRPMSLPDDAHVELTVGLGTTRMTLRQVFELAVGQVVSLGRPLGGPFEVRAAGTLVGKGELVDVDGELAVRIVSLGDQE